MADTLTASILLFCILNLVLVPPGALVVTRYFPGKFRQWRLALSYGISVLIWSLVLVAGLLLKIPSTALQLLFALTSVSSLYIAVRRGALAAVLAKEVMPVFILWLLYFLFAMFTATFPRGELSDTSARLLQTIFVLPTDNLIPYNFSRYIVEGINPVAIEVVPSWTAGDRGPLAGLITAFFFILFGLKETAHWLSSSPGLFFVYEGILAFLNSLVVLSFFALGSFFFGQKRAVASLLILFSSYFFLQNVIYTWPKFFMAYFVLSAFSCLLEERSRSSRILAGLFLGMAMLAHDSAIFYVLSFITLQICFNLWTCLTKRELNFHSIDLSWLTHALPVFVLVLSPWQLYRMLTGLSSPRLLYLQLFCETGTNNALGFWTTLSNYVSQHGLSGIVSIKISNILYPLNVLDLLGALKGHWAEPYALVTTIAPFSFYKLTFAVGPVVLLSFIFLLFKEGRKGPWSYLVALCYLSLLFAALLSGCSNYTWNHIWVYPTFAVTVLGGGALLSSQGFLFSALYGLAVAWNVLFLIVCFYFNSQTLLYFHVGSDFLMVQVVLFALTFLTGFVFLGKTPNED